MNWWARVEPFVAAFFGAIGGCAIVVRFFGDWWLKKLEARHSEEMAQIAYVRSMLLADRQNAFSMGTSSHMATVLFDRYIDFCEEYAKAISDTLSSVIQEGRKDQPLDAEELFWIRQKWALWLYHDVEVKLDRFERDFREIGSAPFLDKNGVAVSREVRIRSVMTNVIAVLRETLATEELTSLRNEFVKDSVKRPPQIP
jgi:hypothetical protein